MKNDTYAPILRELQEKSKANANIRDGDYIGEDGLWYCGNCHTAKQIHFSDDPKYGYMAGQTCWSTCKCESERIERERREESLKANYSTLQERCFGGDPDDSIRYQTFQNDKGYSPELMRSAWEYYTMVTDPNAPDKLKRMGLAICGGVGAGKSYAAVSILNELMRRYGYTCQMVKLKTVTNTLWNSRDREGYTEMLTSARFLYIDDVREEYLQGGKTEVLYDLLERRQEKGKPVILTTNIPWKEFCRQNQPNDIQRIYSRIVGMCVPVEVQVNDIRRRQYAEAVKELANYRMR